MTFVQRTNRFFELSLNVRERALVILAAVMLASSALLPLWQLTMFAPQYPDGLRMNIYSYKLDGGNGGQDVREINVLNHYIGMKDIEEADFTEFKWMPFVIGAIALLGLRAAAHGRMMDLVDVAVLYTYFAAFSLWSFGYKLYVYGHNLDKGAPVRVPPFMPPVFGHEKLANFDVYSYPMVGAYMLGATVVVLVVAVVLAWREDKPAVMTMAA